MDGVAVAVARSDIAGDAVVAGTIMVCDAAKIALPPLICSTLLLRVLDVGDDNVLFLVAKPKPKNNTLGTTAYAALGTLRHKRETAVSAGCSPRETKLLISGSCETL